MLSGENILNYNRTKFFEMEESSLTNIASISIYDSNLIAQTASIDILLLHGSNLY